MAWLPPRDCNAARLLMYAETQQSGSLRWTGCRRRWRKRRVGQSGLLKTAAFLREENERGDADSDRPAPQSREYSRRTGSVWERPAHSMCEVLYRERDTGGVMSRVTGRKMLCDTAHECISHRSIDDRGLAEQSERSSTPQSTRISVE